MQVFAYVTSPVINTERKMVLKAHNNGAAFFFTDTDSILLGTYTDDANKFESLELLRKIYADKLFQLRFELV